MQWQEAPFTNLLLATATFSLLFGLYTWRRLWLRRRVRGAQSATVLLLACTLWTLGQGLTAAGADLPTKLLWLKVEYLGHVAIPTMWLVFALQYTGREMWLTPRNRLLLALVPALSFLLMATNEVHGFVWNQVSLDTSSGLRVLILSRGPGFLLHAVYSYSLLVVGTLFLVHMLLRAPTHYGWQVRGLLFAGGVPWLANFLSLVGMSPFPALDMTGLGFTVASVAMACSLTVLRRGDIMSVSQGTVLRIMSDAVVVLDGQDRIVYLNPAAEPLLGRVEADCIGLSMGEIWPEWPHAKRDAESPAALGNEMVLERRERESAYDVRVSPQLDWRGQVASQVVVIRDVTERQRVEEKREQHIRDLAFLSRTATELVELEQEEDIYRFIGERLRDLVDGAFVVVNSYDAASDSVTIRSVLGLGKHTETVLNLLGGSPVGRRFPIVEDTRAGLTSGRVSQAAEGLYEVASGRIPRPVCQALEKLLRLGDIYLMGFARKGALFGNVVIITSAGAELGKLDTIETFVNQASVALQRKRAEESLRESEGRFRLLAENAQDIIFRCELRPSQRFSYIGPAVRQLGYSPENFYSDPRFPFQIIHPEDSPQVQAMLEGRVPVEPVTLRWFDSRGQMVWTELRNVPVHDQAGNVVALEGIVRDITERKQLEEQLLRAQRLETAGRIAGQVAHDFNNLLSPLMAYPDLINMQLPEGHPANQYCDAMLEAAEQMAAINEDMMALGRRGHFDQQLVDLNRLAEQAVSQLLSPPDTLAVQLDLDPELLPASGSPAQLLRVIANLVSNAREAMQDDGLLTIRTENVYLDQPSHRYSRVGVGEYAKLSVIDVGCGIPPEIRGKILEPFFTTKTKGRRKGCGLGLSIVQAIVEDHRGYLDLDSEVGKGTTFSVYLPVCREVVREEAPGELRGGKETILLVDDDRLQREVATNLLGMLGYRVETAGSGEEAVAYLRERSADLLILDMIMPPGMDGAETYRRALELRPEQRAIVVSGFAESERVREAQRLGAGGYLRKPVTREKLARAVRDELDR